MNQLKYSKSTYLKQHANNPVHWHAWNTSIFEKAIIEKKLIVISIGYSTCHWCHVMEHESFEDKEVAEVMNANYIAIKVDREEHPEIDQLYMSALQLMTGQGGWPLNVICLSDGRPIYGGTYFKKQDWINILNTIHGYVLEKPKEALAYADKLESGIQQLQRLIRVDSEDEFNIDFLTIAKQWKSYLDEVEGGFARAPKFPLPNALATAQFLGEITKDEQLKNHVTLTLEKMFLGGIYDHINGAFARYSTDSKWHIPHFEKMLYDNSQLLSLYADAFIRYQEPWQGKLLERLIAFMLDTFKTRDKGFASGMDADSEGKEGKYYSFDYKEIESMFNTQDLERLTTYFSLSRSGNWEEEQTNILIAKPQLLKIDFKEYERLLGVFKSTQEGRTRPLIDYKQILGWNALMLSGLCDAYTALKDEKIVQEIKDLASCLVSDYKSEEGYARVIIDSEPLHYASLEDYALLIQALIKTYQSIADEQYLYYATEVLNHTESLFDGQQGFYALSNLSILSPIFEIHDNVIPSSNAIMASNLLFLGQVFVNSEWILRAKQMTIAVMKKSSSYPPSYSQWVKNAMLLSEEVSTFITTDSTLLRELKKVSKDYIQVVWVDTNTTLPIAKAKDFSTHKYYLCTKTSCLAPSSDWKVLLD